MATKNVIEMVSIPEGLTVKVNQDLFDITIEVNGSKGNLVKNYRIVGIEVKQTSEGVEIKGPIQFVRTFKAHLNNMFVGVKDGYTINMKALSSHFPMGLSVKGKILEIKNFIGQKDIINVDIIGDTKVDVKGQNVIVTGIDKDAVGQTAANIRTKTKIRGFDTRVFQDGIYYTDR